MRAMRGPVRSFFYPHLREVSVSFMYLFIVEPVDGRAHARHGHSPWHSHNEKIPHTKIVHGGDISLVSEFEELMIFFIFIIMF